MGHDRPGRRPLSGESESGQTHITQRPLRSLCQDLRVSEELVAVSDVVVLHNVFQFFLPKEQQVSLIG